MPERDWTTQTPIPGTVFESGHCQISCLGPKGASLVSGSLDRAFAELAPGAPLLGLLDDEPEQAPYAVRIARDRALLCTDEPLGLHGWQDGYAISAADDLFASIMITGAGADDIRASCMAAEAGSPSAATLFGGVAALVTATSEGLIVRVQTPEAAALWAHLRRVAATI
jgi:hypothetical protein